MSGHLKGRAESDQHRRSRSRSREKLYHNNKNTSNSNNEQQPASSSAQYVDDNIQAKLYVGNLSFEAHERDLYSKFSKYGTLVKYEVIRDRASGNSRGFGFVKFEEAADADNAFNALHGEELLGRPMKLDRCVDRKSRGPPPPPPHHANGQNREPDSRYDYRRDDYRRDQYPSNRNDYDAVPPQYDSRYDYRVAPAGLDYSNPYPYDDRREHMPPPGYYPAPQDHPYDQRPMHDYRDQQSFADYDRRFHASGRDENRERRQPYICRDFAHKGSCKFGNTCKFSHDSS